MNQDLPGRLLYQDHKKKSLILSSTLLMKSRISWTRWEQNFFKIYVKYSECWLAEFLRWSKKCFAFFANANNWWIFDFNAFLRGLLIELSKKWSAVGCEQEDTHSYYAKISANFLFHFRVPYIFVYIPLSSIKLYEKSYFLTSFPNSSFSGLFPAPYSSNEVKVSR